MVTFGVGCCLKWLSAPEKACAEFYYHQIADKFSLKLPRGITNVERFILYKLVCCFFWSVFECLVPLFNKLIQLPLTYSKFANPSKPCCWVKLGISHQSKLRCCGKLGTWHQSKLRLWCSNYFLRLFRTLSISFPELRSPWPAVGKRELWEHPFQACAIDADCALRSKAGYAEFGYFHCYLKMDAPRAPVFRPLVKGNEALETRLGHYGNFLSRLRSSGSSQRLPRVSLV